LGIGGEAKPMDKETLVQDRNLAAARGMLQVNASGLRDAAMKDLGEAAYFDQFMASWQEFKNGGAVPGLKLGVDVVIDAVGKTWERISK
jgi:hypothetical protein